jgi:hypothetical protein
VAQVGTKRFIPWRIADVNGNPVTGRQLSALQVIFLRNAAACSDALNLNEIQPGLYFLEYTPSSTGEDYLDIYDATNDERLVDDEVIVTIATGDGGSGSGLNVVQLSQDTGGVGALKVTLSDPSTYTLYVFVSQDWQSGRCSAADAVAQTAISSDGSWAESSLTVLPGTYHVVAMSANGTVYVMRSFLQLNLS